MSWLKSDGRWKFVIVGSIVVAVWLFLMTSMLGQVVLSTYTISYRMEPRGQPVKLSSLEFLNQPVTSGQRAWMRVELSKSRTCPSYMQVVFFTNDGVEQRSVLVEWPYKDIGDSIGWPSLEVPRLISGQYRVQLRGVWDCTEEDYFVVSPIVDVEVVGADSSR